MTGTFIYQMTIGPKQEANQQNADIFIIPRQIKHIIKSEDIPKHALHNKQVKI